MFHHHCAGYIETPAEITTLLELTDSKLVGLVFDTGHFYYGAAAMEPDLIGFLNRFGRSDLVCAL